MPRHRDPVWLNYECIRTKNTGLWARCKKCQKEMQGILNRLKKHIRICQLGVDVQDTVPSATNAIADSQPSASTGIKSQIMPTETRLMEMAISKLKHIDDTVTTKECSEKIKIQISKYFYATNTPFEHADHKEFKEMIATLRPEFIPPSAYEISNPILQETYEEIFWKCKEKVKNKTVCMSLAGWKADGNEFQICSLETPEGLSVLVDTPDSSVDRHTSNNLKNLIKRTEENFKVKIRSLVTNNIGNVEKMREELSEDGTDLIVYESSSHMLNLLAQNVEIPVVTAKINKVLQYFHNKHLPSALYKQAGRINLVIPQETKWNTMIDSVRSYLDNKDNLIQLCNDNKDIDNEIINIIKDNQITLNVVDSLKTFTAIASALDKMQRNSTTLAVAVEIWNRLETELKDQPLNIKTAFLKYRKMALYGAHYVANMLDHRFQGRNLTNDQKEEAFVYVDGVDRHFVPFIMALIANSDPFPKYMFGKHFRGTSPMLWWKNMSMDNEQWPQRDKFLSFCEQLMTAVASTPALERHLSSGLEQSKLRHQLGNDKAAKLTFICKYLNQQTLNLNSDLSWLSNIDSSDADTGQYVSAEVKTTK